MSAPDNPPRQRHPREVRIGIVLYGGVSLAVYENGVAQELFRAIRGHGVYSLLKKLIGSDIVVDIISGTSAGGVNGIMLAWALANKRHFAPSADLWRQKADIFALLRKEHDPELSSVLNSDYYQTELRKCFEDSLSPDPDAPDPDELDLFITGTDANGAITTAWDDQGHPIDVKNHRALFKLAVRDERKNNVKDAGPDNLAKLARITSCFPVAFQPVRLTASDQPFLRWGKLREPAVFLDGGILNNKPFTSTMDAIFRRMADREVERFLIYVEPDPEVFDRAGRPADPHSPTVAEAAFSSLGSIPQYQSIAADLEAIQAHNERAERISTIIDAIGFNSLFDQACLDRAGVWTDHTCDDSAYLQCRYIQIRDAAVESILNDEQGRAYFADLDTRRSGRILVQSFDCWSGDPHQTLDEFDVYFRMRRAAHLSFALMRSVKAGKPVSQAAWDVVNHHFKLYEMLEWAMREWLNRSTYGWKSLSKRNPDLDNLTAEKRQTRLAEIASEAWAAVGEQMQTLLYSPVEVPQTADSDARAAFYEDLGAVLKPGYRPVKKPASNLLSRIDRSFKNALTALGSSPDADLLKHEFCRFFEVDRQIFPVLLGAGFESTDIIRVVRFSPRDAQRGNSAGAVAAKVCGSALGAFGGFLKMSWRANDIMVGRFDSCCQLIECLLTKERLAQMPAGMTVTAADVQGAFEQLTADESAGLAACINQYLVNPRGATQQDWEQLVDRVVCAAHRDIEKQEWHTVNQSALLQEVAWGRYTDGQTRGAQARRRPDQLLVEAAANAIALNKLPAFRPGTIAGRPLLDEIPASVRQELGFLAGIRLGESLVASIEQHAIRERVEKSRFYRWTFRWILPALYQWGRMLRTEPDYIVAINTAIPVACLVVIALVVILGWPLGIDIGWRVGASMIAAAMLVGAVWLWRFRK